MPPIFPPRRLLKIALPGWRFSVFCVLRETARGARLIRSTLRPLNELAYAAETLNTAGDSLSLKQMQSIAYKLDSVEASVWTPASRPTEPRRK